MCWVETINAYMKVRCKQSMQEHASRCCLIVVDSTVGSLITINESEFNTKKVERNDKHRYQMPQINSKKHTQEINIILFLDFRISDTSFVALNS
jgi:hypothetical protein